MLCEVVAEINFCLGQEISVDNVYAEMLHCKHPLGDDRANESKLLNENAREDGRSD